MTNRVGVARKLRSSGDRLFGNSFGGGSVKATEIIRASIDAAYDYDELFDRLADLIDPTCKPMITVESLTESLTKYTSECSECGAIFGDFPTREQAETTHPAYCPCCGSRVISIDSGKEQTWLLKRNELTFIYQQSCTQN